MEWSEVLQILQGVASLGGTGLGAYVLVLWLTGNLVSKREHLETREDNKALRESNSELQKAVNDLVLQNAQLLANQQVSVEVARAVPEVMQRQEAQDAPPST